MFKHLTAADSYGLKQQCQYNRKKQLCIFLAKTTSFLSEIGTKRTFDETNVL